MKTVLSRYRRGHAQAHTAVRSCVIEALESRQLLAAIAGWDVTPITSANNWGESPFPPSIADSNVVVVGLTRNWTTGAGTPATAAWGGNNFSQTPDNTIEGAIASGNFATFSVAASAGYALSLSAISGGVGEGDSYNIRRSSSGPNTGLWQYSLDGSTFADIGSAIGWGSVTNSAGNPQSAIDLSGISALQSVAAGTTVTFRLINWGATSAGGSWYINGAGHADVDLAIHGAVVPGAAVAPSVSAPTSASISTGSATLGGNVASDGGASIVERGVVYSLASVNADPRIGGEGVSIATAEGTTGVFTVPVAGLTAGSAYAFRAYATNSEGTAYSVADTFTTVASTATEPVIILPGVTGITYGSAVIGANIAADGGAEIIERGFVYSLTSENANPQIDGWAVTRVMVSGMLGDYTAAITGLVGSSEYSFAAYATNAQGTSYTTPASTFTTLAAPTTVFTPVGNPTYHSQPEYNTNYATSFMVVTNAAHGSGSYAWAQWGFLEYGVNSALFSELVGVSEVHGLSFQFYNTAVADNYRPHAGQFSIYVIPDDSVAPSDMRHMSTTQGGSGSVGVEALGRMIDGEKTGPTSLGIIGSASDWLVGTWSIGDDLGLGYATFNASTAIGSTATGTGVGGSAAVMGSLAAQAIRNDLLTGTPLRFAVVADDMNMAADWDSTRAGQEARLAIEYEKGESVFVEQFAFESAAAEVDKAAGSAWITVTRSGENLTGSATLEYATSDGTGVAGTDYVAASAILTFLPFETSKAIEVSLLNPAAQYGDRTFFVTVSNPVAEAEGHIARLGSITSAQVTIRDARTTNVGYYQSDNASVQVTGPRPDLAGKRYINIEGTGKGQYASFGVMDFNLFGEFTLPYDEQVSIINNITLSTMAGFPAASWYTSGLLNVYLVEDLTTSIQPGTEALPTTLIFDAADPEGLNGQLGIKHLLGVINYDKAQPYNVYTSFVLDAYDQEAASLLKQALNNGTAFRIVVVPGEENVGAGWEGQQILEGSVQWPTLSFNYTKVGNEPILPYWVDPASEAVWDAATQTLMVSGPTSIVGDPAADAPRIVATGTAARITITGGAGSMIRLRSVELSNGASLAMWREAANGTERVLEVGDGVAPTPIVLDAASTLDVGVNAVVIQAPPGGAQSVYASLFGLISSARNAPAGLWLGQGITSSAAHTNPGHGLGLAANGQSGEWLFTEFGGVIVDADSLLIRYVPEGDLDLSGSLDGDDYFRADQGFLAQSGGYMGGDVNYDLAIDAADYFLLDGSALRSGAAGLQGGLADLPARVAPVGEASSVLEFKAERLTGLFLHETEELLA